MTTSLVEAESILAIDLGTVHTRAMLFDIAGGQYRLVALGQAVTTAMAPVQDAGAGVRQAIGQLQEITGRVLLEEDGRLIIPSRLDGTGVDRMVTTASAGPALNLVLVGLLSDVSLESAQRLAASTYGKVVETIGLNDRRKIEAQVDAIIQADPDVIIVAGGADDGADRPINKLIEVVGLACYLLPPERRPTVLYAGNQALVEKVKSALEGIAAVQATANIRPSLNQENLEPAEGVLMQIAEQRRAEKVNGLQPIIAQASTPPISAAFGLGRMVRFLSRVNDGSKGVLGIDLGANSTAVAAALGGQLHLSVYPLGTGQAIENVLEQAPVQEISQWLPFAMPDAAIRDFIHQKALFPNTLPASAEEAAIEQAVARFILRTIAQKLDAMRPNAAPGAPIASKRVIYEPILAAGSVLSQAPTPGQSLMMLLDGLQPAGVTTFVLDQNNLTAGLGAAGAVNPLLPVQVFESGAFLYLGTVISPVSDARPGATILEARLVREDGTETEAEVKQGTLNLLPVPYGQTAQLFLDPVNHTQIGMSRPGRGVKITGGIMGTVIDARGRPLKLETDPSKRRELFKKWLWTLEA